MVRGMINPVVILVLRVRNNVVLHVYILSLKIGPFIFHCLTLVLYQCTTFLPSMWLLHISLLLLILGVGRARFLNILPQNN